MEVTGAYNFYEHDAKQELFELLYDTTVSGMKILASVKDRQEEIATHV
jgi:hypothetical protein